MADRITQYYLLCTIRIGKKAHVADAIAEVVFTKKEVNLLLRKHNGHYIAHEIVVGGHQERAPIICIQ
jgi:hypothetical protein